MRSRHKIWRHIQGQDQATQITLRSQVKEGYGAKLYTIILGMQGSIFHCFKAAVSAVGVQGPQEMALARKLHAHAVTSLSKIIHSRRVE